ncbi:hypothetical protein Emag_006823 [Eimeria magna]
MPPKNPVALNCNNSKSSRSSSFVFERARRLLLQTARILPHRPSSRTSNNTSSSSSSKSTNNSSNSSSSSISNQTLTCQIRTADSPAEYEAIQWPSSLKAAAETAAAAHANTHEHVFLTII